MTRADSDAASGLSPALTLAVAARVLERSLDDMTLPQFRVLALIATSPERANRLASKAAISRPSLTGLLDGLVGRGWIRRVDVDDDRRGVVLEITATGRDALAAADALMRDRIDHLLDAVPPTDRTAALEGLAVLGVALKAHVARTGASTAERASA